MKEKILSSLENINDLNHIDNIINSFSYEDRLNFYNEMFLSTEENIINKLKYVLTSDEINKIIREKFGYETLKSMVDINNRKYLISLFNSLDIDNKVKEFLKLDKSLMIYTCNYIFNTDELRNEFIDRIEKTKGNYDFLNRVVNSVINNIENVDLKIKCIDKIINITPNTYFNNLIESVVEENFKHYFYDLNLSEYTKSILILKCIDAQVAKKYFLKLNDDIAKVNASRRFNELYVDEVNEFLDKESEYLNKNFSFDDVIEMLSSFKNKNNRLLMLLNYSDDEKLNFLSFLSEEEKLELLNSMSDEKIFFKALKCLNNTLSITRALTFYKGDFPKYDDEYKNLIAYYSKINSVDINHLIDVCKVTSLEIIKHLTNDNIKSLINMNDNDFKKFLSFFNENNTKLTSYTLNNIFDAFANKSFNLNYEYIMHYYTDVMLYCQKKDVHAAKEIIRKILYELDENIIKNYTVDSMYNALVKNDSIAIKDFHMFCNEYINKIRKEEIKVSVNMHKDEYLDKMYEVSSAIKEIMQHANSQWINKYLSKMMNEFTPREKSLLDDKILFDQIYEFKLNSVSSPPQIIKTNMFTFNKIMDKFYNVYKYDDIVLQILMNSSVKTVPVIPDIDTKFLINVMANLDVNELKAKILDDEYLCKEVNSVLKKYSFLAFNKRFEEIQLDADTYCDAETVSSIILNYKDIIKNLKRAKTPISMSSILDTADTFNKSSNIYKNIFGEDNFRLITLNPPLNRANCLRQERREVSVRNYITCLKRDKVAIPSFDKDLDINNKKINVVVGNFTNPINLTLGERTGSCMRSGGIGDDLYNFCLNNDNGFHIVFSDPETKEFVSRASGFRNGNTVFLNQLRESVSFNYDSEDLIVAIKEVAKKIIEFSKNSRSPIDNVVISHDKVMENYEGETISLNISNIFYDLSEPFWFDLMPNNAVLLASSNNNELTPIKLGKSNICYYPVQRDKIKLAEYPSEGVKHIEAIEQILSGKKIEEIKLPSEEYEVCYYGEDWYLAIDKNGNIKKKIISKSKDFEAAFNEMSMVLESINKVEEVFKKDESKLAQK